MSGLIPLRPIRLAVIFDQQIHAGGGYQQALNAALLVRDVPNNLADVLYITTLKSNVKTLVEFGIKAEFMALSFFGKLRTYIRRLFLDLRVISLVKKIEPYTPFEKHLVQRKIDLVYFLSPSAWARDLEELNYITTVWDLCHRDDPEFPEVRWSRAFEGRERHYQAVLPRATAIFVDSEFGRKNVVQRYGINSERVYIMPFQGASGTRKFVGSSLSINVQEKYKLEGPYVFYPAQFWAHKNHVYILEGIAALERNHKIRIGAIFSGGDKGNQGYVETYARELGLEDLVRFAGFVPNEEITELYRQSLALVMPSYFGPTNLPPLEAFELGIPVLYSDKDGLRDQVGDAALLLDLKKPESLADHLKNLLDDSRLRARLISAGRKRLQYFEAMDRVSVLSAVLEDFRWRRLCWE
jgi:glycosyltransferase involved in cell wall biosynthesis